MSDRKNRQMDTLYMGANEAISREITIPSSWGSSPESPLCYLYDGDTDISDTNLSGTASVSGSVITTKLISGLTAGKVYKMLVRWTDTGNTLEAWGWIEAE